METVRKFKTNPKLAGTPCGWCQAQLAIGDDAAVCATCEGAHHASCWDSQAGCAKPGCANAPLRQLATPVAAAASNLAALAAQGLMPCPRCGAAVTIGTQVCPMCRGISTPDGIYRGPKTNAPGAVKSLVLAIVGLFICGVILGPLALQASKQARASIKSDPTLGGEGFATAGTVIGILALVGWAIAIVMRASR